MAYPTRIPLFTAPTPIEPLPRASARLGVRIHVKRDDLTGAALGGNKARKLEFLAADAEAQGADIWITCGAVQSNHCRATAYAARRLGRDVHLLLMGRPPAAAAGNFWVDRMLGATVEYLTPEEYRERRVHLRRAAEKLSGLGRRPYVIPEGGSNAVGTFGYIEAMREIGAQARETADGFDAIVCAAGSGGTTVGLSIGCAIHSPRTAVFGITVCDDRAYFDGVAADLTRGILSMNALRFDPDVLNHRFIDGFKGPGYGKPSPRDTEIMRETAAEDALLLDPVYTAKAWHGLEGLIADRTIARGASVLFLQSAGIAAALAHADACPVE